MTDSERRAVVYEFSGFRLDPKRRALTRTDGTPVQLTAKVFDALLYLVEHAGELVGRDALTKALWPKTIVEENNLNVTISALRRALGDEASAQSHIVTVAGRGYQFVTSVRVIDRAEPAATATREPAPAHGFAAPPAGAGKRAALIAAAVVLAAALLLAGYGTWRERGVAAPAGGGTPAKSVGSVSRVTMVTTFAGREETPSLSPEGTHVAFAWDGEGQNQDIYVMRLGAQAPLRLTQNPASEHSPVWSPDSSEIAFVRQFDPWRADIVLVPALGGAERKVQSVRLSLVAPPFSGPSIAWSPDGRQLLFTTQIGEDQALDSGYGFHLLSLDDGLVRRLPLAGGGYDTAPAFSADGSRLAFARYDATTRDAQLMVQDLGPSSVPRGEPRPVPGAWLENPRSPAWSPDGRLVYVKGTRVFEWQPGGAPRAVHATTRALTGFSIIWRGGAPLAVAGTREGDFDIWALPLDPRTRDALGPPVLRVQSTASDWHPRFSPDGRQFAFTSWRSGGADIWVADADGRNPRQLSRLGATDPGAPRWSPDGALLSFMAFAPDDEPHTYVVDPDEGLPTLLTHGAASGWSRDSQYLYVTELGSVSRIVRFRRADGRRERLADGAAAQETADGSRLLYSRLNEPGIFTRSLAGDVASNPEERLVDDYPYPPSAALHPVEGGFYYASYTPAARARALRFYDDAQHAARDIAPLPPNADLVWGVTVSPDGRELLFGAAKSGADIVLLEFDESSAPAGTR
jgi:Tol biopolymer transport system component/DNA-binding winged helix-turn-helix (wHTH) protein